jgi:hypothetical protein
MPRLKRREAIRRANLEELTQGQQSHLLKGWTWFDDGFTDAETFSAAWRLHRDDLMEKFRREHRDDSKARAFGWWFTEHGKERPITGTWMKRRPEARPEHFGYLHTSIFGGLGFESLQESEWDYLERLDLLTNEEKVFLRTSKA